MSGDIAKLLFYLVVALGNLSTMADTIDLSLAGFKIGTQKRQPLNGLDEERIVIRSATKGNILWSSDWGHSTDHAAFGSGVKMKDFQIDVVGDGLPKLYVWVASDSNDYLYTLSVIELGQNVHVLAKLPECPGEHPVFIAATKENPPILSVEQFYPIIQGNLEEIPTKTIFLSWSNGGFHTYKPLMLKQAWGIEEMKSALADIRRHFKNPLKDSQNEDGVPWKLWVNAGEMAWSGNESQAISLIEKSWPKKLQGMKSQESSFLIKLRHNPWYGELYASNQQNN